MAENDELLMLCLERPNDLERLGVYSDWLEQHGDDRARYVRAQLALRRSTRQQRAEPLAEARRTYPKSSAPWLRRFEQAGIFEAHLLEYASAWWGIGVGARDTEHTYARFPFSGLPPLPSERIDGRFKWLRGAPVVTTIVEVDPRDWEQRLQVIAAEGYEVPEFLNWLLPDPDLQRRVPTCTDCYFLSADQAELHRQEDGDAFLTFYSDSQACLTWGVRLGPSGDHYAPVLVGSQQNLDMEDAQDPDEPYSFFPELELCAHSLEEFVLRWWLENSIWFATRSRNRRRPLNTEEQAYFDALIPTAP